MLFDCLLDTLSDYTLLSYSLGVFISVVYCTYGLFGRCIVASDQPIAVASYLVQLLDYTLRLLFILSVCILLCDKMLHTLCVVALTQYVYSPNRMDEGEEKSMV